jgi:hypothetical protein
MSHDINATLRETINELRCLINFLEGELLDYSLHGDCDNADQAYGELVDARAKLAKIEDECESGLV